ncbi:MAG: hypothetical protein FWC98_04495, partial [Bacteroidales bacterium]|nr:hypothetical protein [Bacteroidales bacterium]
EKQLAELEKEGFKFDEIFTGKKDKAKCCIEQNIDIMIDDCNRNCAKLADAGIKTLYFRERNVEKIEHKNITMVDNWMHIYKELLTLAKS